MALAPVPTPRSTGLLDILAHKVPLQARAVEIYRRLLSINELATSMHGANDVEQLQVQLSRAFQDWMPDESIRLCVVDGSHYRRLRLAGSSTFGDEGAFPLETGLAGFALASGMPLWVSDTHAADPGTLQRRVPASGFERCVIILPFSALGRVVGALELVSPKPDRFDEVDYHLAFLVAAHLSSSLENVLTRQELASANARLRDRDLRLTELNDQLQQLAHTDDLTGLFNKRRLIDQLKGEIARARRYGEIMSCLMVDVDDFKVINDTLGHQAGDEALRQLAGILRGRVRVTDFVARYGGEEFTILLPRTDANGARRAAEHLREGVKSHRFNLDLPGSPLTRDSARVSLTISIGIVTCTRFDNLEPQQVILRADNALYRSKRAGKDRVCCSDDLDQ